MISNSQLSNQILSDGLGDEHEIDRFAEVANSVADAAGEVIRRYFRKNKSFEILDKEDLSPVTIADRTAEESMVSIILENFPSHAMQTLVWNTDRSSTQRQTGMNKNSSMAACIADE